MTPSTQQLSIEQLQQAINQQPENTELRFQLALAYREQGKLQEAISCLRELLKLDANFANGYFCFAVCLSMALEQQLIPDAQVNQTKQDIVGLYSKGLSIAPSNLAARYNLALFYHQQGAIEQAVDCYQTISQQDAHNPDVWSNLGACYQAMHDVEQAEQCYEKALAIEPEHLAANSAMIGMLDTKGEVEHALAKLETLIGKYPGKIELLMPYAQLLKQQGRAEQGIDALNQLDVTTLPKQQQAFYYYTLGDLFDDVAQFDNAFSAYRSANQLMDRRFSVEEFDQYHQQLANFFTAETIAQLPEAQSKATTKTIAPQPIFIIGMPRSGTSLVEQVLASHTQVYGAGELKYLGIQTQQLTPVSELTSGLGLNLTKQYPEALCELNPEQLSLLAEQYQQQISQLAKADPLAADKTELKFVTDKMWQNFEYLPYIAKLFPKAKFIHCRRHPYDVALSCYFQSFGSSGPAFSYDLKQIAHYYQAYEQLMSQWQPLFEDRIYRINYQDMVDDFENNAKALVEFVGLEWQAQCADFYKTKRQVKTASYAQVRQPIYRKALNRYQNYQAYLEPLKPLADFCSNF
jgi:tetratricopeptide (TPR) repeat protein